MKEIPLQKRIYDSWISIVLSVVSIIQGLALSYLAESLPEIYNYTLISKNFVVLIHFVIAFLILLRIFQTYISAALAYDKWEFSFLDIFIIFAVGIIQYMMLSFLKTPNNFRIIDFHYFLSIISLLGILGYFRVILRLTSKAISYNELPVQVKNILGSIIVLIISLYIIYNPLLKPISIIILVASASLIIVINIIFSVKSILPKEIPNGSKNHDIKKTIGVKSYDRFKIDDQLTISLKDGDKEDVEKICDITMDFFDYIYTGLLSTTSKNAKLILKKILLIPSRINKFSYRSFKLIIDELNNEYVGLVKIQENENKSNIFFNSLLLFALVRHLGIIKTKRAFKNFKLYKNDSKNDFKNSASITYIAIKKEYQNRGIGSTLIKMLSEIARTKRKELLTLEVRESNKAGYNFFKSQGFTQHSILKSDSDKLFDKGHRIIMHLKL